MRTNRVYTNIDRSPVVEIGPGNEPLPETAALDTMQMFT